MAEEQKTEITLDAVKTFLTSDENGKDYLKSYTDSEIGKAIHTYEEKTVPNLVEKGIDAGIEARLENLYQERHPEETEQGKEIRKSIEETKKVTNELIKERRLSKALKIADKKNIPSEFVENLIGDDDATTEQNINDFEKLFRDAVTKANEGKIKGTGREDFIPEGDTKGLTPKAIVAMTKEERAKYDPAVIENILKKHYG